MIMPLYKNLNQNTLFMNPTFVVRTMFISLVYKYLHIEIQEI